jgi:hypothetical protein
MDSRRPRTAGLGETDRLLHRIRTLIRRTGASPGGNDALLSAQRLEIDRLKSELAECVKRNPTGSGTASGQSQPSHGDDRPA